MGWSGGQPLLLRIVVSFPDRSTDEDRSPVSAHPTRYLLQSIPFLIPSTGLPAHRFWQFLLWIVWTAGTAIALSRRARSG